VGIFINAVTTIKVNEEKISNVQKDVEDIKKVTNDKQHGLSALEKNFEVFKTEVSKDLEYIKKKIKL
jgi:predicted  nucleic acid-binding Zn-ribbon protein